MDAGVDAGVGAGVDADVDADMDAGVDADMDTGGMQIWRYYFFLVNPAPISAIIGWRNCMLQYQMNSIRRNGLWDICHSA